MINFLLLVIIVVLLSKFAKGSQQSLSTKTTAAASIHKSSIKMVEVIKTEEEFNSVIKQSNLVVVDFFATWCGPCKMIAPMLEKFSQEYTSASFYKVDVDELPSVASSQSVTSMPTLLFFKSGELVGKVIGANPAAIKQTLSNLA